MVLAARNAHGEWDRTKRDLKATVLTSQTNENTKGCRVEKDLTALLIKGDEYDAQLVDLEQQYLSKKSLDATQRKSIESLAAEIYTSMKAARAKSSALKPLFTC